MRYGFGIFAGAISAHAIRVERVSQKNADAEKNR
jgi:hypothetical protein